jgi:methyltransferase (TIGR00027 family)
VDREFSGGVKLKGRSSAEKVAYLRALGARERDARLRNPDAMAEQFVAHIASARISLRAAARSRTFHAAGRWLFERIAPGAYWGEVARVKHFDRILLAEAAAGVGQVVILGAGLDSRAYRFAAELEAVRVFEVDHPLEAGRKQERLAALFGVPPVRVTYVSADLTEVDLGDALSAAGFDASAPVLVLWVGVVPYLPAGTVVDLLSWVASLPSSSSVAFDYFERAFFGGVEKVRGARRTRRGLELSGERLASGFEPAAMAALMAGCGLAVKSHVGPREQEERYLCAGNGAPAGHAVDYSRFLHAEVAVA